MKWVFCPCKLFTRLSHCVSIISPSWRNPSVPKRVTRSKRWSLHHSRVWGSTWSGCHRKQWARVCRCTRRIRLMQCNYVLLIPVSYPEFLEWVGWTREDSHFSVLPSATKLWQGNISQGCVENSVQSGVSASVHAWIPPVGRSSPGRHFPGQTPPLGRHPPTWADYPPDGHCSRHYVSYWNAFLS